MTTTGAPVVVQGGQVLTTSTVIPQQGKCIYIYILQIWTDPEGNIRLYGPRESNIARGLQPWAILLSLGSYNLICLRDQSIIQI